MHEAKHAQRVLTKRGRTLRFLIGSDLGLHVLVGVTEQLLRATVCPRQVSNQLISSREALYVRLVILVDNVVDFCAAQFSVCLAEGGLAAMAQLEDMLYSGMVDSIVAVCGLFVATIVKPLLDTLTYCLGTLL